MSETMLAGDVKAGDKILCGKFWFTVEAMRRDEPSVYIVTNRKFPFHFNKDTELTVNTAKVDAPVAPTSADVKPGPRFLTDEAKPTGSTLFNHVARAATIDEMIAFLEDTSVDQAARIIGALVWLKANREQMLEDESFSKFVDEHTRPAPNGGETAAETVKDEPWPVVLHNGVAHAVYAAGGPADGSLYGMHTFCNLEVLDNQEDPDWREVENGQVTCEICKIGIAHEQKENKRLERAVHEHVANYIAKNADALSDLKATPAQPTTAAPKGVKLTAAQQRIADKLASGWTVHSPIENCMTTWRRPGGFPTADACNISSLKAMKQRGFVVWEDGQWVLTPAGVAALAARESEAGKK